MSKPLIQEWTPLHYTLEEGKEGKMILRGEFGRVDTPTQNKRMYSRKITEREIGRLNDDLRGRRVYGELDHPSDGKTKYQRVSHIITDLEVQEDGRVIGSAEVLDTPNGRIVKAIAQANGGLGVSSRGFGSVISRQDGVQEVGEDFRLKTYDIVVDPAMKTANPDVFSEAIMESEEYDWVAELRADFPDLVEEIRSEEARKAKAAAEAAVASAIEVNTSEATSGQREEFERRLRDVVIGLREEVREDLREEFESDPGRGASVAILGQIASLVSAFQPDTDHEAVRDAMKAKDVEIAKIRAESDGWMSMARKAGYKLCVEQETAGHPMRETIIAALGNLSQFSVIGELRAATKKIKEDLDEIVPTPDERSAFKVNEEILSKDAEIKMLREQLDASVIRQGELSGRLQRAIAVSEDLRERLIEANSTTEGDAAMAKDTALAEAKLRAVYGYTNGPKLLKLMENIGSQSEIVSIVRGHGETAMSDSRLEAFRQKLTRGDRHDGGDTLTENGVSGPVNRGASRSFMDQTAGEIMELAGEID